MQMTQALHWKVKDLMFWKLIDRINADFDNLLIVLV
jgi:hypothetical protein